MFKQRNMTRKLKQRLGRAVSIVMSAAMIVTALPADLLGGIASVNAAPGAGTATVLNVSDMTKGKVSAGAMNGSVFSAKDDSMTVVEDTQTFDGEDLTQSLKLTKTSAITFDAAKGDTLTVYAMADNEQSGSASQAATKLTVTGEEKGTGDAKQKDTKEMALTKDLDSKKIALAVDGSYTLAADGAAKVFYLELKSAGSGSVETQTTTYVWDTTKEPVDGDIVNGAKLGDKNYFKAVLGEVTGTGSDGNPTTVKGKFTKKTGGTPAAVTAVELSKWGSASVDFTVKGTASVTIEAGSTGGKNLSTIALKGADGKYVTPAQTTLNKTSDGTAGSVNEDGSVVVANTKGNTLTYENLPAGTYSIVSPVDTNNRGVRVIKVTVADTVEIVKEARTFVWDTTKEAVDGDIVNGAKLGDKNYFKAVLGEVTGTGSDGNPTTVKGKFTKKTGDTPAAVTAVELSKWESASVDFTVKGTASVTIEAGSTGGKNLSTIALKGADGKYVTPAQTTLNTTSDGKAGSVNEDGSVVVANTKGNTLTYENLPAGTYSIVSPVDTNNRGVRVIKVTVVDTAVWSEDTLIDWSEVAAPEIISAKVSETDKGIIEVQAKGLVGNGGADSMKVVMFDKDNKEVDSQETLVESEDAQTLKFQPAATGSYTFVAHLVREGEEDKLSAVSAAVAFVLPLATPVISGVSNTGADASGKGGLAITWDEVPEAEKYKVTIVDAKDAAKELASGETKGKETTITLGGLEVGAEVTVSVVAMRGTADVSKAGTINAVVKASGGTVYEVDLSQGLKAGVQYAGGMLSVMADMEAKKSDTGVTYVKGSTNPKDANGKSPTGTVPVLGTVVVVKTPETYEGNKVVRFTVSSKASGKTFYLVSKDARGRESVVATYVGGSDPIGKKFVLDANKEYYFYASGSNQEIYQLKLEYQEIVRGPWAEVEDPVIVDTVIGGENNEKIVVTAKGLVGDPGADSMSVHMYDAKGDLVETKTLTEESDGVEPLSFEFVPTTSGKFSFKAALAREGEATKYSEKSKEIEFKYPLATPEFAAVTNKGADGDKAKLEVMWLKVNEARKYKVSVYQEQAKEQEAAGSADGSDKKVLAQAETSAREYTFEGLPKGETVIVSVVAVREGDTDVSKPATKEVTLTGEFDRTWIGASYGSNAKKSDTATVNADGTISINASSSTKIVPGSTDGLMYYYTKLDASENFTLTAKLKSTGYTPDNGQEGFGIMAADAVGEHGNGAAFWNNSYQIVASQMQYNWDPTVKDASGRYVGAVTSLVSDSETVFQNKMRLGIGWTHKQGVTYEDKQKIANGEISQPAGWSSAAQGTLETSVPSAIMDALYKENLITNDSTPEEVQAAYRAYSGVYRGADKKDDKSSTPYGQFNIIGGGTKAVSDTLRQIGDKEFTPVTEMIYQIQRNNTGYNLRYMNPVAIELTDAEKAEYEAACTEDGKVKGTKAVKIGSRTVMKVNWSDGTSSFHEVIGSKVLYDDSRNSLNQIDMKNLYVGFFAARKTKVDVTKYGLETVSSDDDFAAEEKVKEIVPLQARVLSAESSNSEKYELIFTANADGKLYVINKTEDGKTTAVASDYAITAGKRTVIGTRLKAGVNNLEYVFKASKDYVPGENKALDKLEARGSHQVIFASMGSETEIWVAPDGTSDGTDKAHPTDIYSAVAYAKPGQTIQLMGGEYNLGKDAEGKGANQNILIARGIDGTKDKRIVMQSADPANRAVLNFKGVDQSAAGLTLVASYWHLKNFDVTHSKNGQDGVLIAGKYNVIEGLNAYENGNTGIQLSRYGSDGRDLWPAHNLVLNCTSYMNYDEGYQDADGFAAKLTVGDGNRFSGCVAAYNADDGWDLFAKVQTGNIGVVTIENCVAYKNGLLLGKDKTATSPAVIDYTGEEFPAGNGNGFKLGGDGLSGHHVLRNSVAFGNTENGIDSNSCPDIEIYNCISFNNKTNLALSNYDSSVNSAYIVRNLLSVDGFNKDGIRMLGKQITGNIYNTTNYFWDGDNAYTYDGSPSKKVEPALPAAKVIFESTNSADAGVNPAQKQFIARKADGSIDLGNFLKLKEGYQHLGGRPGDTNPDTEINKKTPEVAVFAAATKYLSDVALPDELKNDYEWVYPMTLTAPFAGTKAELDIRKKGDTGEGDATVIVDFVELTGVKLTLSDDRLIGADGSLTMTAEPVYVPAELPCKLGEIKGGTISVAFNDKSKLGLTVTAADGTEGLKNAGVVTRGSGAKQGLAKYTATITLNAGKTTSVTSAEKTFQTWPAQYEFSFDPIATDTVTANLNGIRFAKAEGTAPLQNLKVSNVADSKGAAKTDVKVTIGDKKVAKVTGSGSSWTVTAVAPGATYLTLTAAADKKATLTIPVIVEGEAYAINASMITIDRAKTTGAAFRALGMTAADPTGELVVKAIYKGANKVPGKAAEDMSVNKNSLKLENTAGSFYTITAVDKDDQDKAIDMIKAGTYTVVLASAADQNLTFDPFTLKVIETKPTVTFKQTKKVNMYYTAGTNSNTGFVTATSKLAKVNLTQNDPANSDFRLVKSGSGYNIVLKDSAGEKFATGGRVNTKIAVTASFEGYKDSYSKGAVGASDAGRTVINVSLVTQAPKYVLEIDNKVFYEKLGIDSTEIRVFDKTSGTYVNNAEIELANTKAGYKSKFDTANKKFYMIDNTLYLDNSVKNNKGGTAKIRVVHPEFAKDKKGNQNEVILNAPISLNTKDPSVTVKKMTLTCQQKGADGLELAGVEQAGASVVVRNAMDYTIRDVELDPKTNAKAKALLPYLDVDWGENGETGEQMLYVSLQDPDNSELPELKDSLGKGKTVAPGSYTYDAKFTLNNLVVNSKVSIKIVDKPTATARVKGSLNILDRSGSKLTVTGSLRNMNGEIVGMRFGNDSTLKKTASQYKPEFGAASLFDVEWQYDNTTKQGSAVVTLKDDASYRVNGKYKVTPIFQIATGSGVVEVAAKPITIVTKQTAVKFASAPVLEVKLSKPDVPGTANMAISSPKNLELNEMEQLTMKDNFEVDYDPNSGEISVAIVNCAGLKANKVYSIALAVKPAHAGSGAKQQTVTVKVKVIN